MPSFFTTTLAAAALALTAGAASAAHVVFTGNLAGEQGAGGDDMIALSTGPFNFGAVFVANDLDTLGGVFEFNFVNDYASAIALTITDITINQRGATAGFLGGVETTFGMLSRTTAQGFNDAFEFVANLGVGESITLMFEYGDAYGSISGRDGSFVGPDIDFLLEASPVPVPVPAAGFMLLAGFGGLAAARRRKG